MTQITKLHEELLSLLLKQRQENKDLKFWLRTKDSSRSKEERLAKGYWFLGNGGYLFFSPFKKIDGQNRTNTIGLTLGETEGVLSWAYIEIVFHTEDVQNRIDLYKAIIDDLNGLKELRIEGEGTRVTFHFKDEISSLEDTMKYYFEKAYPIFIKRIEEFNEQDTFFITDLKFNKQLQKTLRLRDRLNYLIIIEYPSAFAEYGQFQTNFRSEFNIPDQVNKVDVEFNGNKYENLSLGEEGAGRGRIYFNHQKQTFINSNPELKGGEKIKIKVTFNAPAINEPNEEELEREGIDTKEYPLNQILYGPPGTGKTFNTVRLAAEIVDSNFEFEEDIEEESYEQARKIYKGALHNQIEFVTFHQNFSYEDFIQGIRPIIKDGDTQLGFEKIDGVFKQIADRAKKNLEDSKKSIEELGKEEGFKRAFHVLTEQWQNNEEDEILIEMKSGKNFRIYDFTSKSIKFHKPKGKSSHTLSRDTLCQMFVEGENKIIQGGLAIYYEPLLAKLLSISKAITVEPVRLKNYVIVIDEINRANISRVFGELITLIEKDKRTGNKYAMKVKLPSGDDFEVPKNLHIIGTMNTADKSIALLDVALRRRFKFIAKYPDSSLDGVLWQEQMDKINDGILAAGKSRDFLIGHSYFMNEKSTIAEIMNEEVIPLLMEYFMNNEDQVKVIVEKTGLKIEPDVFPIQVKEELVSDEPV